MADPIIPESSSRAVSRALSETFGVARIDEIRRLKSGHLSDPVFRMVVNGSLYVLRILVRTRRDPARHFSTMRAAAEASLAPKLWYSSTEDCIAITDFIDATPFPNKDALRLMPALLRNLHGLAPFAPIPNHINTSCTFLLHPGQALDDFFKRFEAANILSTAELRELVSLHSRLAGACTRDDADMVSSHNDLKPENIVFDGTRPWLIDWEAASLNDRYSDLAVLANCLIFGEEEEIAYLNAYFGEPPDDYRLARFFLMRQVAHLFSGMAWLFVASLRGGAAAVPADLTRFHREIWASEIDLDDPAMKAAFGRFHLAQLHENARRSRFIESLEIVSGRHRPLKPSVI